MATTSLWHIEGRLKDLIDYVENPEKTKAKAPELQDLYNCVFLCPAPRGHAEGRVCHRPQLPEGNRSAADDPHQEALRKDGRLYRLAWVSELQAGGGHAAACPRDWRKAGKGNVGRPP